MRKTDQKMSRKLNKKKMLRTLKRREQLKAKAKLVAKK